MAEYLLKERLKPKADWTVCSAGLCAGYGMQASRSAVKVMANRKIDITEHRSRQLDHDLVNEASVLIVMTAGHSDAILSRFPEAHGKVYLLKSFDTKAGSGDIVDPVGSTTHIYEGICVEIEKALPGLISFIKALKE